MSLTSSFYQALQWSDTAFPSGRYTLSHGLEGLVAEGIVGKRDEAALATVTEDMLRYSFAPVDLAAHFRTWEQDSVAGIMRIDAMVHAARPTFSQRRGSVRVGKQMLFMARELGLDDDTLRAYSKAVSSPDASSRLAYGHSPVVMALIHRSAGLDSDEAAQAEAFGFVSAVASAAVRLQVADFVGAQRLIRQLAPVVTEVVETSRTIGTDDIGACTPLLDIASARHETAAARLFIT